MSNFNFAQTTTATPAQPTFQFDKPSDNLPVPVEPKGEVSEGLQAIVANPVQRQGLVCKDFIDGDMLVQAESEARQLLPQMLNDSTVFINYGVAELNELNRLVDRVLKEVEPIRIPEAQAAMQDLKRNIRAAQGKFDLSNPKTQERLQKAAAVAGKPRKWFNRAGDIWSEFRAQTEDLVKQIEKLEADLTGRAVQLARNAEFCVELYNENDREITKLFYVIGVMELILENAQQQASQIPVGNPNDLGNPNSELRGKYADLIRQMEVKIGEYKGRLFVAWASAPQLRMMRAMDVDMAMKMHMLVQSALPTTKMVLVQWRMLLQAEENKNVMEASQDFANTMVQGYFQTAGVVMPQIAQSIQRQTLTSETVNVVVDSLAQMVDGIGQAYAEGQQKRLEVDRNMIEAQRQLSNIKGKVDDAVIDGIISNASRPLALTQR